MDNQTNSNNLDEEKDEIQDELNIEADALLKELIEDNRDFEEKMGKQIDDLARGVDSAIGEMKDFQEKVNEVIEDQGKKTEALASEIDEESRKELSEEEKEAA